MSETTYWIGDDGDYKSVCINHKVYGREDEIPVVDVAPELVAEWESKGLISVTKMAPVLVKDTEAVSNLESEIERIKSDLAESQKENKELKASLGKAQSGKKAAKSRELEGDIKIKDAHIKELEDNAIRQSERIEAIENSSQENRELIDEQKVDIQEKAALITKLNKDIETLTNPDTDSEDVVHED